MPKIYIYITCVFLFIFECNAQQLTLYSQYMFNGLAINPAYAGSSESINVTGLWRRQWSGVEGAPSSQTLSVHSPIKKEKIGIGLLISNEKAGVMRQTGANISYSYRIRFENTQIAMGLQAGFIQYRSEFGKLNARQNPDNLLIDKDERGTLPNFGTGIFYYGNMFYVGLSAPQLLKSSYSSNSTAYSKQIRQYFLSAGYVFPLNEDLMLKPNILAMIADGTPAELDLNMNLLIKEIIWTGISCRSFNSINFLLQLKLIEQMNLGYAYELGVEKFNSISHGSHEFVINYNFSYSSKKVLSPRYF